MRPKIIEECHSSLIGGHKGITKTCRRIRERYTWPGLRDQITEFIRGCKSCFEQKLVRARTREPMLITYTPAEPFDKVSLDTVGKLPTTPNGNRHILTMQENFSKYCIAVPIPNFFFPRRKGEMLLRTTLLVSNASVGLFHLDIPTKTTLLSSWISDLWETSPFGLSDHGMCDVFTSDSTRMFITGSSVD